MWRRGDGGVRRVRARPLARSPRVCRMAPRLRHQLVRMPPKSLDSTAMSWRTGRTDGQSGPGSAAARGHPRRGPPRAAAAHRFDHGADAPRQAGGLQDGPIDPVEMVRNLSKRRGSNRATPWAGPPRRSGGGAGRRSRCCAAGSVPPTAWARGDGHPQALRQARRWRLAPGLGASRAFSPRGTSLPSAALPPP